MFRNIFNFTEKIRLSSQNLPKHVAISIEHAGSEEVDLLRKAKTSNLKSVFKVLVKLNIPIASFYLPDKDSDFFTHLFQELYEWSFLNENQVKVSVLGKWYNLPTKCIDEIKSVLNITKDYDRFFLNLCINYDGQEEIIDACRLIAMQVKANKLDPDKIDKSVFKENVYSSYFMPPNLVITTGPSKQLSSLSLWDLANSKIFFSEKNWLDFTKNDLLKGIERYQNI